MLKVENIISLWRVMILTWYQSHALNLVMSIEFSSVEQRNCYPRRFSQKVTHVSNKWCNLFENFIKGVEPRLRGGCSRALQTSKEVLNLTYIFQCMGLQDKGVFPMTSYRNNKHWFLLAYHSDARSNSLGKVFSMSLH